MDACEDDPLDPLSKLWLRAIFLKSIFQAFKFRKLFQNCNKLFYLNDLRGLSFVFWSFAMDFSGAYTKSSTP